MGATQAEEAYGPESTTVTPSAPNTVAVTETATVPQSEKAAEVAPPVTAAPAQSPEENTLPT